ncbi:MAG TPA: ABC transporter substrate-binding protein [Chloroflexota bacterium]
MRKLLAGVAAGLLLAGCGGQPAGSASQAGAAERTEIVGAYGTTSGSSAPLWIAGEQGFFKKYGLNVNIQYAESNAVTAGLLAGEIQIGVGDGPSALGARAAGGPVKIIGTLNKRNSYAIVARPDVKTPAELRGKSLAIAKLGDTSDISARIALQPYGIQVGTDVTALSVGNSAPRLASLLSGQVAAAVLSEAFVDQAVAQGMHVLVNLNEANIPYIAAGLEITEDFARSNPNTVLAYLKGIIEGEKFYADEASKDQSLAILGRYLKAKPEDAAVQDNYRFYHARLAHDITPEKEGADTALEALKSIDPGRYANVTSESLIDASFMDKLKSSGFLKSVWGES